MNIQSTKTAFLPKIKSVRQKKFHQISPVQALIGLTSILRESMILPLQASSSLQAHIKIELQWGLIQEQWSLKKSLKTKTGFSFVEVLAALVILSAALIPIMLWIPTSIQTKLQTERKTIAIFLCQSKIEELHYKIIKNFDNSGNPNGYSETSIPFANYQGFLYTVTDDRNATLKTISVKVWHIEKPQDATIFYTQVANR